MNFANSNSIWWLPPPFLGKQGSSMSQKWVILPLKIHEEENYAKNFVFEIFVAKIFFSTKFSFLYKSWLDPSHVRPCPKIGSRWEGSFTPPPSLPFSFIIVCLYIAGDRSLKTISNKSRSIYKERLSLPRFQSTFPLVCLEKKWIYRILQKIAFICHYNHGFSASFNWFFIIFLAIATSQTHRNKFIMLCDIFQK